MDALRQSEAHLCRNQFHLLFLILLSALSYRDVTYTTIEDCYHQRIALSSLCAVLYGQLLSLASAFPLSDKIHKAVLLLSGQALILSRLSCCIDNANFPFPYKHQ